MYTFPCVQTKKQYFIQISIIAFAPSDARLLFQLCCRWGEEHFHFLSLNFLIFLQSRDLHFQFCPKLTSTFYHVENTSQLINASVIIDGFSLPRFLEERHGKLPSLGRRWSEMPRTEPSSKIKFPSCVIWKPKFSLERAFLLNSYKQEADLLDTELFC